MVYLNPSGEVYILHIDFKKFQALVNEKDIFQTNIEVFYIIKLKHIAFIIKPMEIHILQLNFTHVKQISN